MAILNKHNTKTFLEDELEEAVFRGAPPIKHSFEDTNGLLKIHMDTPDSATLFIKWDFLKGIGYKGVIFNNYGSGNLYISSGTTWDDNFGLINEGKNKVYIAGITKNSWKGQVTLKNMYISPAFELDFYIGALGDLLNESVIADLKVLFSEVETLDLGESGVIQCNLFVNCSADKVNRNNTLFELFKTHLGRLGKLKLVDRSNYLLLDFKNNIMQYVDPYAKNSKF